MTVDEIIKLQRTSVFNKQYRKVDFGLADLFQYLLCYTDPLETSKREPSHVFDAVPDFQRSNDKWTQAMQIAFVENVILGFRPTISLYRIGSSDAAPCKILDGVQRLSAIYSFMEGKFTVFGHTFEWLQQNRLINGITTTVSVHLYEFDDEQQVVNFYISINENISHSKDDIAKAKHYLAKISSQ